MLNSAFVLPAAADGSELLAQLAELDGLSPSGKSLTSLRVTEHSRPRHVIATLLVEPKELLSPGPHSGDVIDAADAIASVLEATGIRAEGAVFDSALLDQRAVAQRVVQARALARQPQMLYDRIGNGQDDAVWLVPGGEIVADDALSAPAGRSSAAAARKGRSAGTAGARPAPAGHAASASTAQRALYKEQRRTLRPRRALLAHRVAQPAMRQAAVVVGAPLAAGEHGSHSEPLSVLLPRGPLFRRDVERWRFGKRFCIRWAVDQYPNWWDSVYGWAQPTKAFPPHPLHMTPRAQGGKGRLMAIRMRAWRPVGAAEGAQTDDKEASAGGSSSITALVGSSTAAAKALARLDASSGAEREQSMVRAARRAAAERARRGKGGGSDAPSEAQAALAAILAGEGGRKAHWLARMPLAEALEGR
ncbi:hypothetical protein FNF31_03714 [Cafeteria roenbergensis]|uniref:Uncharacterized protein n=1 Tax=Cafeteria roenbergensis TaxID=33653 RepID=A0A5A8DBE2_CAFRO|nr:hypothetical protein FNF31_03714 [Cafeteria roenbergensis]